MTDYVYYVRRSANAGGNGTDDIDGSIDGGHAYDSLDTCIADIDGQTYANTDTVTVLCKRGSGGTDESVNIPTLSSTNWPNPPASLTIKTHGEDRPGYIWDPNKFVALTVNYNYVIYHSSAAMNVIFDGFQIKGQNTVGTAPYIAGDSQGGNFTVRNCIIDDSASTGGTLGPTIQLDSDGVLIEIYNNLIYDSHIDCIDDAFATTGETRIYHNTIVNSYARGMELTSWGATRKIFNNLVINSGNEDYYFGSTYAPTDFGGNISSDNDVGQWYNHEDYIESSTFGGAAVLFKDAANDNYRPANYQIERGVNLENLSSTEYDNTDLIGRPRKVWSPGAFEAIVDNVPLKFFAISHVHEHAVMVGADTFTAQIETGTLKYMLPDGRIITSGDITYTEQGPASAITINGVTTYTSVNGVTTFTSINGVT